MLYSTRNDFKLVLEFKKVSPANGLMINFTEGPE